MNNLLTGIIGSKTRIKLLVRLFFNPESHAYLRELASEFGVSTNAVREELNQLKQANLLTSSKNGRQIHYAANQEHPLFPELRSMVRKAIGVDQIIDSIVTRLGDLEAAYLIGDYAEGKDTGIIDLILVGKIDPYHLNDLSIKTERYIQRKIRSMVMDEDEFITFSNQYHPNPIIKVWESVK